VGQEIDWEVADESES